MRLLRLVTGSNVAPTEKIEYEQIVVVFNVPAIGAARYARVELADGQDMRESGWNERDEGCWTLGPFLAPVRKHCDATRT